MLQGWKRSRRAWALAGLTGPALFLATAGRTLAEDTLPAVAAPPAVTAPAEDTLPAVAAPPAVTAPAAATPAPAAAPAPDTAPTVLPGTVDGTITTSPVTGNPIAAPGTPSGDCDPCKQADKKPEPPKSIWAKVPPIPYFGRPGYFAIPPSGPGYYSGLDCLLGDWREKRPPQPWGFFGLFPASTYDWDFRYLDDPKNTYHDFFDPIKRIHLGDNWLMSLGGEVRIRSTNEADSRLTTLNDNYLLTRTRLYADLWYRDQVRFFAEYLDAHASYENQLPLIIDVNRSDFLNLFMEVKLLEIADKPAYLRAGRQELFYGSQRLVSPLEWANNRRTFDGVKGYWQNEKLSADFWWAQPVRYDPSNFDAPNHDINFSGAWFSYRRKPSENVDLYYLNLDSTDGFNLGRQAPSRSYNNSNFGLRYVGDYEKSFLWDFEGMYQFGPIGSADISAGAWTTALGYHLKDVAWNPTWWVCYDWASGDNDPGNGNWTTFNQMFPFGHYYFGWCDLVGRQNITDLSTVIQVFPTKWITTFVQYHYFQLESSRDALYNAAGRPTRQDLSGRAGNNVGSEIDWVISFHLTRHQDLLLGVGKFFAGTFIERTGPNVSPEYTWIQYSYRF